VSPPDMLASHNSAPGFLRVSLGRSALTIGVRDTS
jgi:hypothetical protein